ncbi:gp53-like domain-containing protein, partial [Avibacterium avium]|uniref:gp53-like domain-containing protein n=1 Tax=Avibacterium avium TaxID=751 RepID=UPI003BF860C5
RLAQDLQGKADKATTLAGYGITDGLTSLDFLASLNANGYQKLPSGLIIQWGIVDFTSNSSLTCTFPIVFPRNVFSIMTHDEGSIVGTEDNLIRSKTVTGFTLTGPSNRNKLAYLAIGY